MVLPQLINYITYIGQNNVILYVFIWEVANFYVAGPFNQHIMTIGSSNDAKKRNDVKNDVRMTYYNSTSNLGINF